MCVVKEMHPSTHMRTLGRGPRMVVLLFMPCCTVGFLRVQDLHQQAPCRRSCQFVAGCNPCSFASQGLDGAKASVLLPRLKTEKYVRMKGSPRIQSGRSPSPASKAKRPHSQ